MNEKKTATTAQAVYCGLEKTYTEINYFISTCSLFLISLRRLMMA